MAVGCWDQTLSFYQLSGTQHLKERRLGCYPTSLSYYPNGEYLVVGGCLLVLQGTRSFGMEPQPDLYVTGAIAVIALLALDMANKKLSDDPKRKRR